MSDVLGTFQAFTPKFVKKYADLAGVATAALTEYVARRARRRASPRSSTATTCSRASTSASLEYSRRGIAAAPVAATPSATGSLRRARAARVARPRHRDGVRRRGRGRGAGRPGQDGLPVPPGRSQHRRRRRTSPRPPPGPCATARRPTAPTPASPSCARRSPRDVGAARGLDVRRRERQRAAGRQAGDRQVPARRSWIPATRCSTPTRAFPIYSSLIEFFGGAPCPTPTSRAPTASRSTSSRSSA